MTENIEQRYLNNAYLIENPSWHGEHASWKASHIDRLLHQAKIIPQSICDIGCGAGGILVELKKIYPEAVLHGYDISPDLEMFWNKPGKEGINFHQGDIHSLKSTTYDVILAIDLIEHLANPFDFLQSLKGKANHYIFHIPLDLSALSVAREKPLLHVREKVGHIHYYTKSLALAMLTEAGYQIINWHYTHAYRTAPTNNLKTKIAMIPRMFLQALNQDLATKLLGGETLMVIASLSS